MDDIGETEDIPDTDVGAAAPGGVTTAVTIIQKTVWEQTLLAFQQLGVRERDWGAIVKPESKSPIPCPNRPQILTLRSDQVKSKKPKKQILWTGLTQ